MSEQTKLLTLRNGIVVESVNPFNGTVRCLHIPDGYGDKDGDNWHVGETHWLYCDGSGGIWGTKYDVVDWNDCKH